MAGIQSKYSRKITTIKNTAKKNYTLYAKWKKVTVKTVAVKKATNGKVPPDYFNKDFILYEH